MLLKIKSKMTPIILCLVVSFLLMPFESRNVKAASVSKGNRDYTEETIKSTVLTSHISKTAYATALKYSIDFYDANKCGKNVKIDNVFTWRGPCFLTDGKDVGHDLTGGYNDAGDCVKFGLPQGYSAAVLGWSLYTYKDVFKSNGDTKKMMEQLRYFTDYFLKCHTNATTFYYQIGNGDTDHSIWCPPEKQTEARATVLKADPKHPASDVLGETSAALSLMCLNCKSSNAVYGKKCLKAAKELYAMGKTHQGLSSTPKYYVSTSYGDDMSWAAIWLYKATGDKSYLSDAEHYLNNKRLWNYDPFQDRWTMCWNDMYVPSEICLYDITHDKKYRDGVEYNLNYWEKDLTTTKGGLKFLDNWGSLRYSAAASMVALIEYGKTGNKAHLKLAKSQIDYILGKNPMHISYMIGFGSKWCRHVHHRAANGYTFANNDWTKPAKHLLLGGLVGGPKQNDNFVDDITQYQYTEVALDYNAGFVGALAGMSKYYKGKGPAAKAVSAAETAY